MTPDAVPWSGEINDIPIFELRRIDDHLDYCLCNITETDPEVRAAMAERIRPQARRAMVHYKPKSKVVSFRENPFHNTRRLERVPVPWRKFPQWASVGGGSRNRPVWDITWSTWLFDRNDILRRTKKHFPTMDTLDLQDLENWLDGLWAWENDETREVSRLTAWRKDTTLFVAVRFVEGDLTICEHETRWR